MENPWDSVVLVIIIFGLIFFSVAVAALYWAAKNGQFNQFEKGSRVIFDEEEPEGVQIDHFPDKSKRRRDDTNT